MRQVGGMGCDLGVVLAPDLAGRLLQHGLVARGDHDAGAFCRESMGDGEADALRAAGDQDLLALETEIHGARSSPRHSITPRAGLQLRSVDIVFRSRPNFRAAWQRSLASFALWRMSAVIAVRFASAAAFRGCRSSSCCTTGEDAPCSCRRSRRHSPTRHTCGFSCRRHRRADARRQGHRRAAEYPAPLEGTSNSWQVPAMKA